MSFYIKAVETEPINKSFNYVYCSQNFASLLKNL
jgi:hypothetical protein